MKLRAAAFALALLACLPQAQAKDDLVIGVAQFPSSLNPYFDALVIKGYVLDFSIRPVTAFDKDWKLSCVLCTTLPTIENGGAKFETTADGKKGIAVTLTLKPDLKWSDGTPVTTKDLMFTWKLGANPASGFSNGNPWSRAVAIDVADDHTATLHLDKIDVTYNQWDRLLPAHIEAKAAGSGDAGEYVKGTVFNRAPTTPGLYNGPFMVTGYESGSRIVLEQNPHWAGQKPYFKRIIIKTIENTAALSANLLSGDIDMAPGDAPALTIDQVIALRNQKPDAFNYVFQPSLTYEHINVKTENPILADIKVRRALLAAIDRETMVKRLFEGKQPVAATWVNPLNPNYTPDVPVAKYDPAAARALLAEAGWKPGADGICRNAAGDRLSLEFSTTAGNKLRELQQQVLQSQWKASCIEVVIKNEPARTLFGETVKKRSYTGLVMYGWSSAVTEGPRRTLHSSQIPTAANNYGGSNASAMNNPQMDAWIEEAESELDPAKAKLLWAKMQAKYAEETRVLPLFFRAEPYVLPKWLKGLTPTGHGDTTAMSAEAWRAE